MKKSKRKTKPPTAVKNNKEATKMAKSDFNNDVFEMVNNPERQRKIQQKYMKLVRKKNDRILWMAIIAGSVSMFFGLMGVFGGMVGWIAYPVFSACGVLASFMTGRWYENAKHWGLL
jgi:hypothetical protein